ncbi:MAG: GNAT family N-acetyltransferase [Candidatus Dormibacteria bacterium]
MKPAEWRFRPRSQLGSLFEAVPAADTTSGNILTFCQACHAEWMVNSACFGYDIHSHDIEQACTPTCYTQRGSRFAQFNAMRMTATNRTRMFYLTKRIDGMPGINGSSTLAAQRAFYFLSRTHYRQTFYESVPDYASLLSLVNSSEEFEALGLPQRMRDQHHLIFEVFESAHTARAGVIHLPKEHERSLGLHQVLVTGIQKDGGEGFRFWNSWGTNWGIRGSGSVSIEYLTRYFHDAWVVRSARWGPSQHKQRFISGDSDAKQLVRDWQIQNPRMTNRFWGSWRTYFYESLSPTRRCPIECLEVRNWIGIRVAWIFLYHDIDSNSGAFVTELTELFVWPPFRRVGLATALEKWACDRARGYGSREIRLVYNEADNHPSPLRTAGRVFGPARGYQWRRRTQIGPRAVAIGIKVL